ncbi:hypothetical protein BD779DRAFT_417417 [Infundibulicybe gibba]|nr:hypothetical protein BD779DRAFT_417417 [Infundibulicybe gibba]
MGCLYVSLGKRRDQRGPRFSGRGTNKFLFTISIILFVLTTSHWIIQILRSADAFIANTSGGPDAYYDDIANPKDVAKTVLYIAQTLVGDLTMIYRLYMVWGRNWKVVVLPSLFTLGFVVVGSAVSASFAGLANGRVVLNTSTVGRLVVAVFTTTLVTNLVVTGLISYRVWSIYRRISAMMQRKMDSPLGHQLSTLSSRALVSILCVSSSL